MTSANAIGHEHLVRGRGRGNVRYAIRVRVSLGIGLLTLTPSGTSTVYSKPSTLTSMGWPASSVARTWSG